MATVVDDVVAAQLNSDVALSVRTQAVGDLHALERLRSSFDQDGRAIGASIASIMVQAALPAQDSAFNASVRTPYGVGPSGEFVPPASVVGGGATASK